MTKPIIAILDDSEDTLTLLNKTMNDEFSIVTFTKAQDLINYLTTKNADLFILDIDLDGENGFDICTRLKSIDAVKNKPVIFLSQKKTSSDKITGFTIGGDDYVEKPFNTTELKLRIAARLKNSSASNEVITFHGLKLNRTKMTVIETSQNGESVALNFTLSEYKILDYLLRNPNKLIDRVALLELLNTSTETSDRVIDVHISNLKKKSYTMKGHLKSIYGEGYKLIL